MNKAENKSAYIPSQIEKNGEKVLQQEKKIGKCYCDYIHTSQIVPTSKHKTSRRPHHGYRRHDKDRKQD